jgi:LPS-assembly lipoprotein
MSLFSLAVQHLFATSFPRRREASVVSWPAMEKDPRRWDPAWAGTTSRMLVGLFIATVLTACGFQLRGSTELPFRTLWVGFSDASPLGTEFRRYIRSGTSTRLVDSAADAEARLTVLGESRDRDILSLDATGQVREYVLYYVFLFKVDDGKGRDFIAPTRITLKRDISVDNNTILAKQAEEDLLYRDMQSDLVQQLLRRLAAVKPSQAPAT